MAAHSSTRSIAQNPFVTAPAEAPAAGYEMVQAGPAVDPAEVETSALAVELLVKWSDTVLHVSHMSPARSFTVGEDGADLALPASSTVAKTEVVSVIGGAPVAIVPAGASATIYSDAGAMSLEAAKSAGLATAAGHIRIQHGVRVEFEFGGCSFEIGGVAAAKKVAGKASTDKRAFGAQALSFGLHAALLGSMFVFMPALASTEDNAQSDDQLYLLRAMMQDAEQAREEDQSEKLSGEMEQKGSDAGSGAPSPGEAGMMGSQTSKQTNKKFAMSTNSPERQLSRREVIADAENFGMVELLGNLSSPTNGGPSSPWGTFASGNDPLMANGNIWGAEFGEAGGANGLYLSGTGEGAGGEFEGVGVGNISTIFGGAGTCTNGPCDGIGNSTGRLQPSHKVGSPKVRVAPPIVGGRLPPEVIQRVVRQNFGRFRACYETGLRSNPNLQGRVSVAFSIGRDGAVGGASNAGSDLPDSGVVSCVVSSFRGLSFPAPEAGIVTVSYPISFSPQ